MAQKHVARLLVNFRDGVRPNLKIVSPLIVLHFAFSPGNISK